MTLAATTRGPRFDNRWAGLGVLATALALIVIDGSIVAVALPSIVAELGMGISDAQWVNSIYAVVFSGLLLASGRLGDWVGRRRTLIAGVTLFVVGSVFAAMAGTASALIAARLVQGVGGALILPATLSSVNATFRGRDRAAAFGIWGAVMSGAAALGPLLGGWLTQTFDWRWIFWVNVPLGVAVVIASLLVVRDTRGSDVGRFDGLGFVLSALGFASIVFGIIEAPTLGWFTPEAPLGVLGAQIGGGWPVSVAFVAIVFGAAMVTAFVLQQRHRIRVGHAPLLDLRLFRLPTFAWGNLTATTVAIGEFALLFLLPLFLVNALGLDVLGAGLLLAAMALGAFIAGASARHLAARFGAPGVVILGLALEVVGVAALAVLLGVTDSVWVLGGVLVVYGVGLGLASAQLTSTVLSEVPPENSGQGSATQSTFRQLGTALGATVSGAVLSAMLTVQLASVTGPAASLAEAVHASAGSSLVQLRASGTDAAVLTPLTDAFTHAAQWSVGAAAVFLLFGLAGAVRVRAAARRA